MLCNRCSSTCASPRAAVCERLHILQGLVSMVNGEWAIDRRDLDLNAICGLPGSLPANCYFTSFTWMYAKIFFNLMKHTGISRGCPERPEIYASNCDYWLFWKHIDFMWKRNDADKCNRIWKVKTHSQANFTVKAIGGLFQTIGSHSINESVNAFSIRTGTG